MGLVFCKSRDRIVFVKSTYDPLIKQMLGLRHRCSSPVAHKPTGTSTQTHTLAACFQCYHVTVHYPCLSVFSPSNSLVLHLYLYSQTTLGRLSLFSHQNCVESLPVLPKYWINGEDQQQWEDSARHSSTLGRICAYWYLLRTFTCSLSFHWRDCSPLETSGRFPGLSTSQGV